MRNWPFGAHQKVGTFWYRFRFWSPPPVRKYLKSFRKSLWWIRQGRINVESSSNQAVTHLYRREKAPDFRSGRVTVFGLSGVHKMIKNDGIWRCLKQFLRLSRDRPVFSCIQRNKGCPERYDCLVPDMFNKYKTVRCSTSWRRKCGCRIWNFV